MNADSHSEINNHLPQDLHSIIHWYAIDLSTKLLLYIHDRERRICIPRVESLLMDLMQELHNFPFSGHLGSDETFTYGHLKEIISDRDPKFTSKF